MAWLPHEAWVSIDAIARSLWRIVFSHRHLLQWRSSSEVERSGRGKHGVPWRALWAGPAVAIVLCILLAIDRPMVLAIALPVLFLWFVSPVFAWWVSRPDISQVFVPSTADRSFLRQLARRTWAFFETYVGPDDHWLAPDNVQMARTPPGRGA